MKYNIINIKPILSSFKPTNRLKTNNYVGILIVLYGADLSDSIFSNEILFNNY
jgi:hypothetical protein